MSFSKEQLRERLTPLQYQVTQERGTERYQAAVRLLLMTVTGSVCLTCPCVLSAFTGEFTFNKEEGTYNCVVCGTALFRSET